MSDPDGDRNTTVRRHAWPPRRHDVAADVADAGAAADAAALPEVAGCFYCYCPNCGVGAAQVRHYMIQPSVELYGGCMVVLKIS
jgi:hypothetical protein